MSRCSTVLHTRTGTRAILLSKQIDYLCNHLEATGATATATAAGARLLVAAALVVVGRRRDRLGDGRVDAHGDPGEETIGDVVAEQDVGGHRVARGSLLLEDAVGDVLGQRLRVGRVGVGRLDGRDQVLVEEELAHVRDGAARDGRVVVEGGVNVGQDVDVLFKKLVFKSYVFPPSKKTKGDIRQYGQCSGPGTGS